MLNNHEIGPRTQHLSTTSSRPKTSPRSLDNGLIEQIIAIRIETKRCAEVVWKEAKNRGLDISLYSVRRIIKQAVHVERFNRTLREKCLGNYIPTREILKQTQQRTNQYLDFYNNKRLHLGIQFMTPLQKCSQGLELN